MKTDDKSSAIQYANALLQITAKDESEADVYRNLEVVCKVFTDEPELSVLFKHPAISAPARKSFIDEFAGQSLDNLTKRLLILLCERRKMHLLSLIFDEFRRLLEAKHNLVTAKLYCAEQIDDQAKESITQKLVKQLSKSESEKTKVRLITEVDKSLIGGYVLRIGDQVIDGSLKGRLQSIEKALLSV